MKSRQSNNYSHILKYTGVFGGVQGLSVLVGIVRNKLVAMILGPNGMGLMSLFTSTIKLISDLCTNASFHTSDQIVESLDGPAGHADVCIVGAFAQQMDVYMG